jgi:S1-C subfamily serine protease
MPDAGERIPGLACPSRQPTVPIVETLQYVAVPKDAVRPYYSKQEDVPAWHDLYCCNTPAYKREIGESIGLLVAADGNAIDGVALWTCSGFVIANDPHVLFVTNHHCGGPVGDHGERWSNDALCVNHVTVDFSWDGDTIGREYKCEKVAARSPEDDLVVLRLDAMRPEAPPPILPIRSTRASEIPVWTVHHPAAESKKISREECLAYTTSVSDVPTVNADRDFAHRCDTEAGSSGAPMLDAEGAVVGIHHIGFETTGRQPCDKLNKAVHADRLLRLLAEKPELKGYRIVP